MPSCVTHCRAERLGYLLIFLLVNSDSDIFCIFFKVNLTRGKLFK